MLRAAIENGGCRSAWVRHSRCGVRRQRVYLPQPVRETVEEFWLPEQEEQEEHDEQEQCPSQTGVHARLRREEFVGGKSMRLTISQGLWTTGACAFLFGNAEIVSGDQHLHIADNLHNCKQTERDINAAAAGAVERAAVAAADPIRNTAAHLAGGAAILQVSGKRNGLRATCTVALGSTRLHTGSSASQRFVGAERLDISLTAVKNHLLVEDGNAAHHNGGGRGLPRRCRGRRRRRTSCQPNRSPC